MIRIRDELAASFAASPGSPPVEWVVSEGLVDYAEAVAEMESRVAAIAAGEAGERVLGCWSIPRSIPPAPRPGPRISSSPARFPVFATGRGGQYTYHGPGQRVAYVMLDLRRRSVDLRAFVAALEAWLIATLARFNIRGERREDRVGVWVRRPELGEGAEDKIAALGIRVRRSVTFHGISLNVEPDLSHFGGIVPCGIRDHGVTSLVDLGLPVTMHDADVALRAAFEEVFGPTRFPGIDKA